MRPIQTYNVVPRLPAALEPLREIVFNLWWTWEPSARKLFRALDPELWDRTNHSPLRMLQLSRQARLEELAEDRNFLGELREVHDRLIRYLADGSTYGRTRGDSPIRRCVAYFSAEFGFHESIPNYSGGLGILSGDHCKSASDLDLKFCAVGLLYRHGYFKQQIDRNGWQEAINLDQNFHHLPLTEVFAADRPLRVSVAILGREVFARVWKLQVGRVPLFLLDTDIAENSPEDRLITAELYGGDMEMRIRQEIVLGIGGVNALYAMGIDPDVFHMNEGHSAFLSLERLRRYVAGDQLDFYSALQVVAASNVFTTHTPVPAGNDAFPVEMMRKFFGDVPGRLGTDFATLMSFGQTGQNPEEPFSMTIFALRCSRFSNGVSELHGSVSRRLWKEVWEGVPADEVPITAITNGIHTKSWLAPEFAALYERYLGPDWHEHLTDPDYWRKVIDIPAEELWETHRRLKIRLVEFVRERLRRRAMRIGESPERIRQINGVLDPDILTVGFARRFATYKRGTLLFSDPERLIRMISHPERPIQFVLAGKAHPADDEGKRLIQEVLRMSQRPELANRLVFIEDYDTNVGRRLTQGVDLWLNNPLRPLEASGTSGMKTPPNGGLNLSVLDGWWCEGYNGNNGWAIGEEIQGGTAEFQNDVDAASFYQLLENRILPLYYAKPDGRVPHAWIQLMRESIRSVLPQFNTERMVRDYAERLYEPAARARSILGAEHCRAAVELSQWKTRMRRVWSQIRIEEVSLHHADRLNIPVGESIPISARVHLGEIDPSHVSVQAHFGPTDNNHIAQPRTVDLGPWEKLAEPGKYLFTGSIPAVESGAYGLDARVIPTHPHLTQAHELRLITWAHPPATP